VEIGVDRGVGIDCSHLRRDWRQGSKQGQRRSRECGKRPPGANALRVMDEWACRHLLDPPVDRLVNFRTVHPLWSAHGRIATAQENPPRLASQ
jgi:hypothetical protein